MFTGLIEDIATLVGLTRKGEGLTLSLETAIDTSGLALGDSVACDGACLTVVHIEPRRFQADLSHETVQHTTWKDARIGRRVNIERALRLGDRLGGHLVTGHVDGMGRIARMEKKGQATDIHIQTERDLLRLVVHKGSIAVDGISLTVNRVEHDRFCVTLIPHTRNRTTLTEKQVGAVVNLETDIIGKYIEALAKPGGRLDQDFLALHGFIK